MSMLRPRPSPARGIAPGPPAAIAGAGRGKRFVLLASQFNRAITLRLVRGATDVLRRSGASIARIRVVWVPGAFELSVAAALAAKRRPRPDAILALGALIRGDTPQYEILAHAVAHGLTHVSVNSGIPVTFGVIVAENVAQARARAGGVKGNRGEEAALAALAMLQ